ncbi:MAG: hypothetical protein CMH64_04320 [Nanoarchaeota archaeon]|nr:hypothetical protein [Nanoarchaeota archaeon]|tara:strand:+ start:2907 stop:3320 length:414 start_codon:yes stop_codon:yes gene_type:complete
MTIKKTGSKSLDQEIDPVVLRHSLYTVLTAVAGIAVGLCAVSCEEEEIKRDSRLPKVRDNQALISHPDYLKGMSALGYTLLTDIDRDGNWDLAERFHAGFTTGDGSHKLYFKKGFGPAQSVNTEIEFVESEFFEAFE